MSRRRIELALKRQRLQLQAAEQRLAVRRDLARFAPVLSVADTVRAGVAEVKRHPEWLVGAIIVLVVVRPRAVFRWLQRGVAAWQFASQVRRVVADLPAPARSTQS
jgi:hypothetical protein